MTELSETSEKEYKYKIILTKPDNVIASDIYSKIKNKKYYNVIREIVDNDESKIYIGIAFYILRECFEYRIINTEQ